MFVHLGVMLDERESFDSHFELVIGKAFSYLGLIFRMTSGLKDLRCLKALHCSLVRPVVEYASVVFCTNRAGWNNKLKGVQKRFTRCLYRRLYGNSTTRLLSYKDRCILCNLDTLESRRTKACVIYQQFVTRECRCSRLAFPTGVQAIGLLWQYLSIIHMLALTTRD